MTISALDRKLLRDLWAMKGQALAIALVVGAGAAMFVAYLSNFESLRRTRDAYYERQRLADVFATLKRAPRALEEEIAAIPGVLAVETRVSVEVTLDVPGLAEPASGRLLSIPAVGRPRLNDVFLRRGRFPEPGKPDEVLASEAFCKAHRFGPGDSLRAVVNGRRRTLRIVGVALSPEYVYSIRPGELIPDDRRFGIFWMERRALGSAFDMEGGFNEVSLKLAPQASVDEAILRLDRLLAPYGAFGAIPRRLQFSAWTLENELTQLANFGLIVPAIFFFVAAFILNVALTRALALQRPQIASLKALGYGNAALAWHYLKWGLGISMVGAALGLVAGHRLGLAMVGLYNQYFRFPSLDYRLTLEVGIGAVGVSLVAAVLGAAIAVRRAVRIPPAEAMRPEPPAHYRPSLAERTPLLARRVTHATRMILRNLERTPARAAASVVGIGLAGAILVVGFVFTSAMEEIVGSTFSLAQRQDATLAFVEPLSAGALHEVERLPGVLAAEPARMVATRLRSGHRHRDVALTGRALEPRLERLVDRYGRVVAVPPSGLALSRKLAEILEVGVGDEVTVEVLEGRRPTARLRVAALVDDALGLGATIELGALHRLLGEGESLSGARLLVDADALPALNARLKGLPAVSGVAFKRTMLESFRATFAENMNIMVTFSVIFAGIIAFGVVYNSARISLSERERELASLRVLGFTRAEISLILLGELAVLTLLSLPFGGLLGWGLSAWIVATFENEIYRIPLVVHASALAWSALIVAAAAFFSGLTVRRKLDRLDLVAVLKTRE